MSRRRVYAAFLAVLLPALILPPAHAKPLSANYVTLKLGGYFPQHNDLDEFDTGFNGDISIGRIVAPGFAVEGGLGYFKTSGDRTGHGISADEEFTVIPLTLSLKGQTFFEQYEPYFEIGIGAYFIKDEFSGTAAGVTDSRSENDTKIGLHVGLGGNYNVTRQIFVGLEGRYLFLKTDSLGEHVRMDGITLTANAGYRF